ncbi:MAG: acyl dehydratase, partial [Actinobacteria bacterium]|nr:acyl dehydratase [Actinomycetota bacterium]
MSRRTLAVGDEIGEVVVEITREDLRAYAALSGDHNPIHQDDAAALAVGLP